ncbi:MAG: asparaginase [Actinomycetota bacterium]
MARPDDFVPVAIASRNGADESVHFGAVVALGPSGAVEFAVGNPHASVFPRSANKPMQAVAMVRAGLDLPPELLALVCASHDGLPMHIDAAKRILATAGLDPTALANTASLPLDADEARSTLVAGGGATPLLMNCSGKHSGMLATCVRNGWAHDASYLDIGHPLQRAITDTIDELSDESHAFIGVDGCGAPAHMFSLVGLARSFAALASGRAGDAGNSVYAAMTHYPQMVGGPTRDVTLLMRSVPGLLAKDGADGVYAAALPDGRAVAVKIADGGDRARPPVMVAALRSLGVDVSEAAPLLEERILGHGQPVGVVRAVQP